MIALGNQTLGLIFTFFPSKGFAQVLSLCNVSSQLLIYFFLGALPQRYA